MTVIRECINPECSFRYPDPDSSEDKAFCPRCGQLAPIREVIPDEKQLAFIHIDDSSLHLGVVLDNIRSIYNAGSIFRTSDGFGVNELCLCGITPTPQNPRFSKTSLGAEDHLKWSYRNNAVHVCEEYKKAGSYIISLENTSDSANLYAIDRKITQNPLVLIIGNEISGVDPAILQLSDTILAIPMSGYKHSFNVATAYGIALSYLYSLSLG